MARLTRAEQQERTRAAVLAAARQEFTERGYAEAKVDRIAERAELTRGAVYSNFPSKRALYLAVLVDLVERSAGGREPASPSTISAGEALNAFARVWLERLPLTQQPAVAGSLRLRTLTGVLDDRPTRAALAQVVRLEALLLGLALESRPPRAAAPRRRVRLAELVLTLLHGAGAFAETAPGFGDPFDLARACERLADVDLDDTWDPPHLAYVAPARRTDQAWTAPTDLADQLTGGPVDLAADGVIVLLGAHRLGAAEEAVRAAGPGEQVTVVAVTGDPAEVGRLVRLRIGDLAGCLRRVFAADAWPALRLVLDERGVVAAALGVPDPEDDTEVAVRVRGGRIVARAEGRGAGHAAGIAAVPDARQLRGAQA